MYITVFFLEVIHYITITCNAKLTHYTLHPHYTEYCCHYHYNYTLQLHQAWSLNNSRFDDYRYLHRIYPNDLVAKDTTDTQKSASYHDLQLEIDNRIRLKTKLRQTRCFHFSNSQLPFHQ